MNQLLDQIEQAVLKRIRSKSIAELLEFLGEEADEIFKPRLPPPRTAPLPGTPVLERISRRRASVDVVIDAILQTLKENENGVNIADLRDMTGFDSPDIRHAVREMKTKNLIATKGEKRSTRYFSVTPKKQLEIPSALSKATTPPPPPSKGHPHVVRRPGKGAAK